jgi:ABC-type transporter Mla subunit MlaD
LDHTNIILNHEQAQLTKVDEQEAILFTDLHTVAQNVNGEVTSLNTATESLNAFLKTSNQSAEKLPNLVTGLTKITNDADTQINDPNLKKTIANMAETSTQLAGTTTDLRKVSDHFESEIDNPKPKTLMQKIKVVWGVVWQVAMLAK